MPALAVSLCTLVVPAARASSPDATHGGCFFETVQSLPDTMTGDETETGVIGDRSVTTTGDAPPVPIGGTVTCWIDDNAVPIPGTTHSYSDVAPVTGVQAGADPISFVANIGDFVNICQRTDYADGTSESECAKLLDPNWPPGFMVDLLDAVITPVNDAIAAINDVLIADVDPVVCPVLVKLAGTDLGVVTVGPDGDVGVADPLGIGLNPLYDCPPYVN